MKKGKRVTPSNRKADKTRPETHTASTLADKTLDCEIRIREPGMASRPSRKKNQPYTFPNPINNACGP